MIFDINPWMDFCKKTEMPQDQIDRYDGFMNRASFEYRYVLWPRRCYNTGRWLWLTTAMRGRAMWTGPGEPVIEYRWYHRHEALVMMIKGVANGII